MRGQVPVEVARILEADKFYRMVTGVRGDLIPIFKADRRLPIYG